MRAIKALATAPNMQDQKLKALVAQEFQTTIVGMMGHDLRQSLQVIQGTYALLRSRLGAMPQQAWLDRGERAVTKLTEQLNCLVDAFYLAERDDRAEGLLYRTWAPVLAASTRKRRCRNSKRDRSSGDVAPNAHVVSNPVLLGCILRNLLTNAIRYTARSEGAS